MHSPLTYYAINATENGLDTFASELNPTIFLRRKKAPTEGGVGSPLSDLSHFDEFSVAFRRESMSYEKVDSEYDLKRRRGGQ